MNRSLAAVLAFAIFSGCASNPQKEATEQAPRSHEGKVVGTAGGALAGGAMAYSSAGILCTIGGPLCVAFILPAAIVGGVVGLAAGSVVDVARDASKDGAATDEAARPREDTSARRDESARASAPPQPY